MPFHTLEHDVRRLLALLHQGDRLFHPTLGQVQQTLRTQGWIGRQRDQGILAPGLQRVERLTGKVVLGRVQGAAEACQGGNHNQQRDHYLNHCPLLSRKDEIP